MRARRADRRLVVVVSPHFDDAPLSLGQSLRDGVLHRHTVRVEVPFGRTNWTRWVHPTPGRAATVGFWRRIEETSAALRFGYRWRAGRWSEAVLRTGDLAAERLLVPDADLTGEPLVDEMERWLAELAAGSRTPRTPRRPDLLLVCAGLGGHVDHRIVTTAALRLPAGCGVPIGFYEDRPYVSHLDEAERDRQLAALGDDLESVAVSGPVTLATHRRIRRSYPSQIERYFEEAMAHDRRRGAHELVWFRQGDRPTWFA